MAQNRRDSDLSSELYFSIYGNNRKLKPQKIKAYALYKPLIGNTTNNNNFVIVANETNEITVTLKEGSENKVFSYDKVFYSDIPQEELFLLTKSIIQDIIMGLSSFLILCKCASPTTLENKSSFKMDLAENITTNVLKELLLFTNKEENIDASLHVSYFEMHGDKIIDLLDKYVCKDVQLFENPEKICIEIKGLVQRPIISDRDIVDIFTRQPHTSVCTTSCCHTIVFVFLVRRYINNDGLELLKVGKLTLVNPAQCKTSCLESSSQNIDDCLLTFVEHDEFPNSCHSKILRILKPAFNENATTAVIVHLPSALYSLEEDLKLLKFVSETRNLFTHPEIDSQLIIRNSIKEYAEEIKELQKDLFATSKNNGIKIDHLLYRYYKNCTALEDEKVKSLEGQILGLNDSIYFKMQQIADLHAAIELKETETKENESFLKTLNMELEEMENKNNIAQKVSLKTDEIIAMKQQKMSNELYKKKLKFELIKDNRNYEELTRSLHCLKNEKASYLCDIDAHSTSKKSTLQLLIVDMIHTYSEFQTLERDLISKLKDLINIDDVIKKWRLCMEDLVFKCSSFTNEMHGYITSIKLEMSTPLVPLHESQSVILDIIRNNRNEKGAALSYYFNKFQVFCDASYKMLAEIMHQMDVIENRYRAEFKAISAVLSSASETSKKFVNDINIAVKSFLQYFEEQEKELLKITDIVYFHHKFRKQFDDKVNDVKHSLLVLKQMYLDHNDASVSKWSEIHRECHKYVQKHSDLSDHLFMIEKEIMKYLDSLPQQKLTVEYSPLKEKTHNVESRILQLQQIHDEMKGDLQKASEVHEKGSDKELKEIEEYIRLQKTEIEKQFDAFSLKLKANTSKFLDELRCIHQASSNNEGDLKKDLKSLLSSVSHFQATFNDYLLISNNIVEKSERSFKVIPSVSENKYDNILDFENLLLEEWNVPTSTPNISEKKEFNISKEKEKLISRMKSLAELQISQKTTISELVYEDKENKNISVVSLPNLRMHPKAPIMTGKSFSRTKFTKK